MANDLIKKAHLEISYSPEMILELQRCSQDPIYFIESYVFIQHPVRGRVPFKLYDYQKEMIDATHNNRLIISLVSRQAGKTQTISMYLLWFAMFNKDKLIVIASKNNSHAMEIIDRIKYAYEECPDWLKAGVNYYTKHSLDFDNGSRIFSEATTPNTARGLALSRLYIDELAHINPNVQELLWTSISPTISTGGSLILTSTPNGDSDLFAKLWRGANSGTNDFKPFFVSWDRHPDRGEDYKREMLNLLGELKFRQEVLCEFLSSDELLISSLTLSAFKSIPPINETNSIKFWKQPTIGCQYYIGVDIASGVGADYSTAQVFEFPSMEQVAELRNNRITIDQLYARVKWLLQYYGDIRNYVTNEFSKNEIRKNDRLLSIPTNIYGERQQFQFRPDVYFSYENNGLGQTFTVLMNNDEHFPEVTLISSPNTTGITTTGKNKTLACVELKRLLEKGLVKINSDKLLFELKNYIAHKTSFAAKAGCTDDLISAMLIVIQMFSQLAQYEDKLYEMMYSTHDAMSELDSFANEMMPISF